ncbi:tRNA N(3)-methylcytidine methyltransferase METTL6-like [Symsagittifera roscoffensis]|uniref:tRNA N(3)-methylcytidine methyltransferase METTL6-like n=1 Tax=Symsagittifera roscoffensis TaxID=84072 RepID=UPI00307B612B
MGSEKSLSEPRLLTDEENRKLEHQKITLSELKISLLQKEAAKNWDKFYKNNTTKFFKDRHWLLREFQPLQILLASSEHTIYFLEVGCGVGNAFFPLMEAAGSSVFGLACDFSSRAVDFVRQNEQFNTNRMFAFTCDIVQESIIDKLRVITSGIDIMTVLFVLSALDPNEMQRALKNLADVMKCGGKVCVRDYAVNDYAMIRFGTRNHKISDRFYVRQDNTKAYFFFMEELEALFRDAGFKTESLCYKEAKTENREKQLSVDRYFVQAVFEKL